MNQYTKYPIQQISNLYQKPWRVYVPIISIPLHISIFTSHRAFSRMPVLFAFVTANLSQLKHSLSKSKPSHSRASLPTQYLNLRNSFMSSFITNLQIYVTQSTSVSVSQIKIKKAHKTYKSGLITEKMQYFQRMYDIKLKVQFVTTASQFHLIRVLSTDFHSQGCNSTIF